MVLFHGSQAPCLTKYDKQTHLTLVHMLITKHQQSTLRVVKKTFVGYYSERV